MRERTTLNAEGAEKAQKSQKDNLKLMSFFSATSAHLPRPLRSRKLDFACHVLPPQDRHLRLLLPSGRGAQGGAVEDLAVDRAVDRALGAVRGRAAGHD